MAGRDGLRRQRLQARSRRRQQILIITGPNMAGKSTYLRQVALIVLLAQMGSFVPAATAEIGVVDRLFTRVGASDNLAGGESTFMVEMKETADILAQLTPRSLVDPRRDRPRHQHLRRHLHRLGGGRAPARRAAERPLVLFATHYHELTDLARTQAARAQLLGRGARVEGRRGLPAPHRCRARPARATASRWRGWPACRTPIIERARQILRNLERASSTTRASRAWRRADGRQAPTAGAVRRRERAPARRAGRHRRRPADAARRAHPAARAGRAGAAGLTAARVGPRAVRGGSAEAAVWLLQALGIEHDRQASGPKDRPPCAGRSFDRSSPNVHEALVAAVIGRAADVRLSDREHAA